MSSAHVAQLEATGYTLVDPEGAKKGWWRNQDAFARDKMLGSKPPVPETRKKERPVAEERSMRGRKLFGGDRTPEVDPSALKVGYTYLIAKRRAKGIPMENSMIGKYLGTYEPRMVGSKSEVGMKFEFVKGLPLPKGYRLEGYSGSYSVDLEGKKVVFNPSMWSFHELARVSTLRAMEDKLPGDVLPNIRGYIGGKKKTLKRRRSTHRRIRGPRSSS
jgi:hypothetical protein